MNELAEVMATDLGEARLVSISGEIDLSNARDVMEVVGDAVRSGVSVVVVDLSGVTFLDSSGIAALFRLADRIRLSRQELRLVVPRGAPIRRVLELTRVTTVIPTQETLDG